MKFDSRGKIRSGSTKLLVTSGSPAFLVSPSVHTSTAWSAPPPGGANAEKSSGREMGFRLSFTAKSITASPVGERVALKSGPVSAGNDETILSGRSPATVA